MLPVVASASPALQEIEDDEGAAITLHAGDLVTPERDLAALRWRGAMEGGQEARSGAMVELRRGQGGGIYFGFRQDFGAPLRVPSARWICEHAGVRAELAAGCERSLFRARSRDGAIVAWLAHAVGESPVAVVRRGKLTSIRAKDVTDGRMVELSKSTLLLLTTRGASADGKVSGASLLPIRVAGGPVARLRAIPLDQVDARDDTRVESRLVTSEVRGESVHLVGTWRAVARSDGRELESRSIDETYALSELPVEP